MALSALAIGAIVAAIGSLASAGVGAYSAYKNYEATKETNQSNAKNVENTNEVNLQIARENNAKEMDLAKNGISYRVQDMKNAGLNPVLAAGGVGAPQATLSTPRAEAARAQAPILDLNGVSSALNSVSNLILTQELTKSRADDRNDTLRTIANERVNSNERIASERNDTLNRLYKRKAEVMNPSDGYSHIGNARQFRRQAKKVTEADDWDDILRALNKKHPYKY